MKRLQIRELESLLVCLDCDGELQVIEDGFVCSECHASFGLFRGRPVMLSKSNELFPQSDYYDIGIRVREINTKVSSVQKIKRLIPKKSINLAREKMFEQISFDHSMNGKIVLVVGCGNQTAQLERHFPGENTTFVFCDIDKQADADVFCDSHELSFRNDIFDGVISTAVLEHVLYPEKVIAEIVRVLKIGGFLYSEIPFLQSVHEGAYDFTRYTMSGHRRLLESFEEIDAGMVAGPGTALVWSLVDFFRSLSSNRKVSSLLGLSSRLAFFWLKYFDYLISNNPIALSAASCTYFYGTKKATVTSPSEIVRRYKGQEFGHT